RPQPAPAAAATRPKKAAPASAAPLRVAARDGGRLSAPLQDAAAVAVGRRVLLVGGLDAADTSTADIRLWNGSRARTIGRVEHVFHDAAAALLGGTARPLRGCPAAPRGRPARAARGAAAPGPGGARRGAGPGGGGGGGGAREAAGGARGAARRPPPPRQHRSQGVRARARPASGG